MMIMEQGVIDLIHSDNIANLKLACILTSVDEVCDYILCNIGNDEYRHVISKSSLKIHRIGLVYMDLIISGECRFQICYSETGERSGLWEGVKFKEELKNYLKL